jgi:hypothetical protein
MATVCPYFRLAVVNKWRRILNLDWELELVVVKWEMFLENGISRYFCSPDRDIGICLFDNFKPGESRLNRESWHVWWWSADSSRSFMFKYWKWKILRIYHYYECRIGKFHRLDKIHWNFPNPTWVNNDGLF